MKRGFIQPPKHISDIISNIIINDSGRVVELNITQTFMNYLLIREIKNV